MPHSPSHIEEQKQRDWPKIILITLTAILLIGVVVYFIINPPLFKSGNNNTNNGRGLGDNNTIAVGEPNPSTPICDRDSYNCGNFTTQAEAQVVFDACFKDNGDIHRLDADGNGKACEGLG